MGKAERRVSLTKEEIKALCEEAADKAVERSEKARKKSIAQEKKTLLYNKTYSIHYALWHNVPTNDGSHADPQRNPFSALSANLHGISIHIPSLCFRDFLL